jgi:hypothetical protein
MSGVNVGLLYYVNHDSWRDIVVAASVTSNSQGRYSISYRVSPVQCAELFIHATLGSWSDAGVSTHLTQELQCTSGAQRIDLQLVHEPF